MARELSFSLGVGATPLYEDENSELANEIYRLYQAVNTLASQLDAATGALAAKAADRPYILPSVSSLETKMTRFYAEATIDLTFGELVSLDATGKAVKADATSSHTTKARAIALANCAAGEWASLAFRGVVNAFSGLTINANYFLSSTAGAISLGVTTGATVQYIGFAVSSTELYFCPEPRHSTA